VTKPVRLYGSVLSPEQEMRQSVDVHPPSANSTRRCQLRENETAERGRAEALFKKQEQLRKGAEAMAEYEAAQQAIREKTARLRALRLARDADKQNGI
jgi:hypothetical protein